MFEFTIAQMRKFFNQIDNNDVQIITTRLKYNTIEATAKKNWYNN